MFQFSRFALFATSLQLVRFPHSEIRGSSHICWSPRLIAAYHVLHRLWEPRHPPCTLSYFLLRMRLLRRMVCLYLSRLLLESGCQVQDSRLTSCLLILYSWFNWKLPYCCFLFFNYFFQYVKERLPQPLKGLFLYIPPPLGGWGVLWRITDSNRWPPACKAGALASWANPPRLEIRDLLIRD